MPAMDGNSALGQSVNSLHDHESSSERESLDATSTIISSLFQQLNALEKAQRESAETIRLQQEHSDTLRRSVRDVERVLHEQHVARQKARLRRLQKAATEVVEGVATSVNQTNPIAPVYTPAASTTAVPGTIKTATPPPPKATTPSAAISGPKAAAASTTASKATSNITSNLASNTTSTTIHAAPKFLRDAQQDIVMAIDEEDDADLYSMPPPPPLPDSAPAPVAPMTAEAPNAAPKPLFSAVKQTPQSKNVTGTTSDNSATAKSKPTRPVQKMIPSRGRPTRGRGITRGRVLSSSGSGSRSSSSPEAEEAPKRPKRGGIGIGTGRRSRPLKRGSARVSVSSTDEDEEPQFTPVLSNAQKSGFTAVNTPRTWAGNLGEEDHSPARSASPTKKLHPPPRPRRGSDADTPDEITLFATKDLRLIYGGGSPGAICARVKPEDRVNALIKTHNYICLSPDAHFNPPGTLCDNAEMLDIWGQEDPIDRSVGPFPVFKKVNKSWIYCGDYQVGERRMVSVEEYLNGSEIVRRHWAKKVQDTEWGREWLVRKGWLMHNEIRNVSLFEILGFFEISDGKKGLRFSSTALHFKNYDNVSYKKMTDFISTNYPNSMSVIQISSLEPNRLVFSASPQTVRSNRTSSPEPAPANKRRRQEGPAPSSVRTITTTSSVGRGARRISRGNVNYRIAPMNEFTTEEGGKGKDDVVNLESDGDEIDDRSRTRTRNGVEDTSEDVEEEDEGEESEGDVMVL